MCRDAKKNLDILSILCLLCFFFQSVTKTITSDLLSSTRTKIIKDSDESTSDRTIYKIINKPFNRNESTTLSNYPDIEIIRRDDNAVGKSIPHDIPADIELIPMSSDHATAIGKRAANRSFSPENIASKLTKLNDCSVLVTSSNDTPKISNAITMSAINLKMLRESQQRVQVTATPSPNTKCNDFLTNRFSSITNRVRFNLHMKNGNVQQAPVETSISIHAHTMTNSEFSRSDRSDNLRHSISISTIKTPQLSTTPRIILDDAAPSTML